VSLSGNAGRKWLRVASGLIVICLAAAAGYDIKRTPPTYLESAAVIFSLPKSQTAPDAYFLFASSLITSGAAMTQVLASSQVQHQIRKASGRASVSLALTNLYNEEYPNYGEPLATLTAASPSAAHVHRAFKVAVRLLGNVLAARQAQAGVPPRNRILARVIGDTGPMVQAGSPKRVFAGLVTLVFMAVSVLWGLLGRREASKMAAITVRR
jgi:hypothetical protein